MEYLQAAVELAREDLSAADATTSQEAITATATTAAAAAAAAAAVAATAAVAAAAAALTAVEVVAEVDMDGKPPTMKRRRKRRRKTQDQCIPAKLSFQRHIHKLKREGKYQQRLEITRKAASKSNVANKAKFESLTEEGKDEQRAKWREKKRIQSEMKKATELKAKQEAATYLPLPSYLPLPCKLKYNEMAVFMPPVKKEYESVLSVLENLNNYFKLNRDDLKEKYKQWSILDPEG